MRNFKIPKPIKEALDVGIESQETKKKSNKVNLNDDLSEWGVHHFRKYFEMAYTAKFKAPYLPVGGDLKQLSNLVKSGKDKKIIKNHIDNFINLDFFENKLIRVFCSSYCQMVLDRYLIDGKLPTTRNGYLAKELDGDTEWAKDLDDIFKR